MTAGDAGKKKARKPGFKKVQGCQRNIALILPQV